MAASDDHAYRRAQMVEALRRAGVRDERVLAAMAAVPRHLFVPAAFKHQAYTEDVSVGIGAGQTISQPLVVALMTQAARVSPDDRVLEVGTGSGYQAAVLAHMARFVCSVERISALAREAKARIDSLGLENVSIKVMDGSLGCRAQAPYAAIVVTAGAPDVPAPLLDQLVDGGRLVVPVGSRTAQVIKVVERRGPTSVVSELRAAYFVPLVGLHGWEDEGS